MAKKKKEHAHPDERWLLTYADMITLLFVLFLVLFSISSVNISKFEVLKRTLKTAFADGILDAGDSLLPQQTGDRPAPVTEGSPNVTIDISPQQPQPPSPENSTPEQVAETGQLNEVKERIDKAASAAGLKDKIKSTVNERGLAIRLVTDGVLFDPGSATLKAEGRVLLDPIGNAVKGLRNSVVIEGHTDTTPIRTAQFPNNRWLGGARAFAVEDELLSTGLPDARVQSKSFGETNPIAENTTPAGRAKNRRVEILVLRQQGEIQSRSIISG